MGDLQFSPLGASILMSLACLAVVVFVVVVMVKRGIDMTCPGCGGRVGRGILDCPSCGFDFRTSSANPS